MVYKQKKESFFSGIMEFAVLLFIVFLIRTFGFGLYQVPSESMETTMLVGERFFADKFSYFVRAPKRGEVIAFNQPDKFYKYSDNRLVRIFQQYVYGPENWTKRVIGVPGDHVRGVIENGTPVIYVNDKKLDEPYLNKYPLVRIFNEDPRLIQAQIQADVARARRQGDLSDMTMHTIARRYFGRQEMRSYDPAVSFECQPFYRMHEARVERGADGKPILINPGTPISAMSGAQQPDVFDVKLGDGQYWLMGDNRLGSLDSRVFGPVNQCQIHGRIVFRISSIDSDESWQIWALITRPIDFWSRIRWSRFFQMVH